MSTLPKVSVKERILLHLHETEGAPLTFTQAGIAAATGRHRSHVSRALSCLCEEGLVTKARRRIPGFSRTLLVCSLTPDGREAVAKVRGALASLPVPVVSPDGGTVRHPLGVVLEASGPTSSLIRALERLESDGRLGLDAGNSEDLHRSPCAWDLEDAPVGDGFVARDAEYASLAAWMRTPEPSYLLEGPGGIGKSTLALHVLQTERPPRHVLWVRLGAGQSPELLLARVDSFLARLGRPAHGTTETALERLPDRLRGASILIILDDVHKASEAHRPILERLAVAAGRRTGCKLLWIGRTLSLPVEAMRRASRTELSPLTMAESMDLLARLAVAPERREAIARRGAGNPLYLELLALGRDIDATRKDFVRHLVDGLAQSAPDQERLLQHLCALRAPASHAHLERLGVCTEKTLDRLLRDRLVTRRHDGAVELHDEVREALYDGLGPDRRRRVHAAWARVLRPDDDLETAVEYLHHLTMAGHRPDAAWWVLRNQNRLLEWARGKFRTTTAT